MFLHRIFDFPVSNFQTRYFPHSLNSNHGRLPTVHSQLSPLPFVCSKLHTFVNIFLRGDEALSLDTLLQIPRLNPPDLSDKYCPNLVSASVFTNLANQQDFKKETIKKLLLRGFGNLSDDNVGISDKERWQHGPPCSRPAALLRTINVSRRDIPAHRTRYTSRRPPRRRSSLPN